MVSLVCCVTGNTTLPEARDRLLVLIMLKTVCTPEHLQLSAPLLLNALPKASAVIHNHICGAKGAALLLLLLLPMLEPALLHRSHSSDKILGSRTSDGCAQRLQS